MGLNANSGGHRTPANDQKEKWTFGFGRVHGLVCSIAVSFGNSSFSRWPPYWKAFEILLKIFTVFSGYTYCWMFIFSYLLQFIISRRALAREGDYEMMSVCACVCALVSYAYFSKTATATDFL